MESDSNGQSPRRLIGPCFLTTQYIMVSEVERQNEKRFVCSAPVLVEQSASFENTSHLHEFHSQKDKTQNCCKQSGSCSQTRTIIPTRKPTFAGDSRTQPDPQGREIALQAPTSGLLFLRRRSLSFNCCVQHTTPNSNWPKSRTSSCLSARQAAGSLRQR